MYFRAYCAMIVLVSIGACMESRRVTLPPLAETVELVDKSSPSTPNKPARTPSPKATTKPTDFPTATAIAIATATATTESIITPIEMLSGPQIIMNSSFDSGTKNWERPYGKLAHTTREYYTPPSAARLSTTDETGFLDYQGSFGQCIDLSGFLEDWPVINDQKYMTLEAFLHPDAEISNITVNGIFSEDTRCGTGHVGYFEIPSLEGNLDWTNVSSTTAIPVSANSLHVFVNASGTSGQATVLIDDIRAYPSDPAHNP
jgi:hypothetical protein